MTRNKLVSLAAKLTKLSGELSDTVTELANAPVGKPRVTEFEETAVSMVLLSRQARSIPSATEFAWENFKMKRFVGIGGYKTSDSLRTQCYAHADRLGIQGFCRRRERIP